MDLTKQALLKIKKITMRVFKKMKLGDDGENFEKTRRRRRRRLL